MQSLRPAKLFSQQLPTFLLFRDRRSVAQQCWIRLHSSSNIVGATHAHYAWFTKTYGLYPSHDALQVPTLLGVVASAWTPLPTRTQQLPTLLVQRCWKLLRLFARSLTSHPNLFHLHFKEFLRIKPPLCSSVKCLYVNASLPRPCSQAKDFMIMHFGGVFKMNGLGKIRLKKILPFESSTDIYRPFIAPHFNYCSESWHHCSKGG